MSSATSLQDACDFCKMSEENDVTGELQISPDGQIVAHVNCMLYSPLVISIDSQEDLQGFDYDIASVLSEINRGQKLPCNLCRKRGATVGCDVRSCRRTYHFPCVIKAKGSVHPSKYVVYCEEHKMTMGTNGSKSNKRVSKRKRWQQLAESRRRNAQRNNDGSSSLPGPDDSPHVQDVMQNEQINEQPEVNFIIPIQSTVEFDSEEVRPSTSRQCVSSGSTSEESDSLLSPRVKKIFSLSGFPKTKKKYNSNRKPNEQLNEVLETLSSQEKNDLAQIYSELGGSLQYQAMEVELVEENENGRMTTEHVVDSSVTDDSACTGNSDPDKTPERLQDTISGCSTDRNHLLEEQSLSSSKRPELSNDSVAPTLLMEAVAQCSGSNTRNTSCASTSDVPSFTDTGSDIPKTPSNELSNGKRQVANPLGLSNIRSPSDLQPAEDLEAQGTSESCPARSVVSRPESASFSPLTLEKESKTVVSTSIRASNNNDSLTQLQTLKDKKEEGNKRTLSNIVSPQQITAISRKLVAGTLSKHFRTITSQIQSAIHAPKSLTTKDREHGSNGQMRSEGSPNPHTTDQPAGNHLCEHQENEDDTVHKMNLECPEKSKSIICKKLVFHEINTAPQQDEGNLPEQAETPEDTGDYNVGDYPQLDEALTPRTVQSEWASVHQSGPSATPHYSAFRIPYRVQSPLGSQHGSGVGDLDHIDAFGCVVAGQCRRLPQDRQAKYMSYVLASADLFCAPRSLPDIDILIANLRDLLERSQQLTSLSSSV